MFDPSLVRAFSAVAWRFDEETSTATFEYALLGDGEARWEFVEKIEFPVPAVPPSAARRSVIDRLLAQLFVAAGISYYKAAAPPEYRIEQGAYSEEEIAFHQLVLTRGLGEFFWKNRLDPNLSPGFEYRTARSALPVGGLDLNNGPLIPVGGGKDSCVTIEAQRESHPTLITVNRYPVIQDVIDAAGLPDLLVRRTIDPALIKLNHEGALNGHVPITTIVSLCVLVAAVLHGHPSVVMSNERSASAGNVTYRGVEINHQWSKSVELEAAMQRLLAGITPELSWYSFLRKYSELAIVDRFTRTGGRYRNVFSSCNAAFKLDPAQRVARWCGTCAKCQFVYLALAPVLSRVELERIFGANLFATSPTSGFEALLGLAEWKPFECVGESVECRVAWRAVSEQPLWADHPVVAALSERLRVAGLWPTDADREAVYAVG